jgi:ketosteroid isomerase-like protein
MKLAGFGMMAAMLAAGGAVQAAPVMNAPDDVKAITAIELDLDQNLDLKEVIHHYADHAVALDLVSPGIYQGRRAIYNGFAPLTQSIKSLKFVLPELNIVSDGTMACAASGLHLDMAMKSGAAWPVSFRQLDVYRKIGGQWQIIQQQISVPMDPKTGLAAMNAAPESRGKMQWSGDLFAGPAVSPAAARAQIRSWTVGDAVAPTVDLASTFYGPGGDVLDYDESLPGELRGVQEFKTFYAPLFAGIKSARVTFQLFTDDSDGVFGAQSSVQNIPVTMDDGSTHDLYLRQTDCLHRVDGKWTTFMEMLSFPVDMKTGKSVMTAPGG